MSHELAAQAAGSKVHSAARTVVRRHSSLVVLAALVVGGLAGYTASGAAEALAPRTVAKAPPPAAPMPPDTWLARARALAAQVGAPDAAEQEALTAALAASPALRRVVLDRYGEEPDRHVRGTLRELLVGAPGEDLAAGARTLATSALAGRRAAGFELLASLTPGEETYALARPRLFDERDPAALAGALAAFVPPGRPSNAETAAVLPRLVELTRHTDPLVRAHAVQRVADWDLVGTEATPIAQAALGDADRLVRQAAVGAVMIGSLHAAPLAPALLRVAGDAGEDLPTRAAALQALERFPLDDAGHAAYLAARADVERRAARP